MPDYKHRPTAVGRTLSYEDGKSYRGYHLNVEDAKSHVKLKQDQSDYFKKDWKYVGSIPMELMVKYQHQLPSDERDSFWSDFATNKDVKAKFLSWFKANYSELLPGHSRTGR